MSFELVGPASKEAILEAALVGGMTVTTIYFTGSVSTAITIGHTASMALITSNFFRAAGVLFESMGQPEHAEACRKASPMVTALLYTATLSVIVHESGHMLGFFALYNCDTPEITFTDLFAGFTSTSYLGLSRLGRCCGPGTADLIATAAGPIAAVVVPSIGWAHAVRTHNEETYFGRFAYWARTFEVLEHVRYAFTTFSEDPTDYGHDFVNLQDLGVHPIAAIISMMAISYFSEFAYGEIQRRARV